MGILSSLAGLIFFWLAFALNVVLLCLQLLYVPTSKQPKTTALLYRFAITFGFSACFSYCFLGFLGVFVGWYLQNRSSSRRETILNWVHSKDQTQHLEQPVKDSQPEAEPKLPKDGNWNGIIGFFHPFWYCPTSLLAGFLSMLTCFIVMLEEAEKGSSGRLSNRRKKPIPMQLVLYTPVIMKLLS